MDINQILVMWITHVEGAQDGGFNIFGSPVAGNLGFGLDAPEHYDGEVNILSVTGEQKLRDVSIGMGHSTKRGFFWTIRGISMVDMPSLPFLITDNVKLKVLDVIDVMMYPAEEWDLLYDVSVGPDCYWLKSSEWFGALFVNANHSSKIGKLMRFSEKLNPSFDPSELLLFADSDQAVFGSLERGNV